MHELEQLALVNMYFIIDSIKKREGIISAHCMLLCSTCESQNVFNSFAGILNYGNKWTSGK